MDDLSFKQDEYQIYGRQISLSNIQLEGQHRLKKAKVLCIGSGGLGSIVLLYLASSGIGLIGIIDNDIVDLSNLNRQVLYATHDVGKYKALSAKKYLQHKNQYIHINTYSEILNQENAYSIIKQYDIIVDCTDNFQSRKIISYTCQILHKIHIYAAIGSFIGQASVFNYMGGPNYNDMYKQNLKNHDKFCTNHGVLGILPGTMGMIQATETIKIITGIGNITSGYLIKYSALNMLMTKSKIRPNIYNTTGLEYLETDDMNPKVYINKEINLKEIDNLRHKPMSTYLIDIRYPYEYSISHLQQAVNIPFNIINTNNILKLLKIKSQVSYLIIYCNSYIKSNIVSKILDNADITHAILKL